MTGTKLYARKRRVAFFLLMYGILAFAGGVMIAHSVSRSEKAPGAGGFMLIFGAGMFIMTLVKSRSPQVSVHGDYLEVKQARKPQLVRYRNVVSVSRPDGNRLIVKLWEDNSRREVTIWLRELEPADADRLAEFLAGKGRKAK